VIGYRPYLHNGFSEESMRWLLAVSDQPLAWANRSLAVAALLVVIIKLNADS
jgi:hypothetical protein